MEASVPTADEQPRAWWAPWALPIIDAPVRDALVSFADGRVSSVESRVSREDAAARGAVLWDGCVLAPGFVNAHSHIEYAAWDGIADGMPFAQWLGDHVHRKRRLSPEHMRASAQLGAWQAAAAGITSLGDASFSGDAAHAMHDVGLRGRAYLEVFATTDEEQALERVLERLEELPSSSLLSHGLSPHAPYTASEQLYRRVAATGLPWMTHLLESPAELELLHTGGGPLARQLDLRGMRVPRWEGAVVERLADLLGPQTVVVHFVQATPDDLEVLADRGAVLAHCPRSNARLGCGLLDLPAVERAGVATALATDSPASAGPLDMFAEMRAALELHRAHGRDAEWPTARRLLRLATVDAALALGYEDAGVLAPGAAADVVACELPATGDPETTYVLTGSPHRIRATMVAGRIVWRSDRNQLQAAEARAADARRLLALPVPSGVQAAEAARVGR